MYPEERKKEREREREREREKEPIKLPNDYLLILLIIEFQSFTRVPLKKTSERINAIVAIIRYETSLYTTTNAYMRNRIRVIRQRHSNLGNLASSSSL